MGFVMIDQFVPVLISRRVGVLDAAAMTRMLGETERALRASNERMALVYDADRSTAGSPDAASRQVAGEWFRQQHGLLVERCAGIDFSFPSPLSRGVMTAVFWIARPPVDVRVHDNARAAIISAIRRVGKEGALDPTEMLRAIGEAPSAPASDALG